MTNRKRKIHSTPERGGGEKEKKESKVIPMDRKVSPADYAKAKPQLVPEELIEEAKRNVKGSEDLKFVGDLIVIYSPCYSGEIYGIMAQVNTGEISFEEGKTAIMDRLVYLLTHEFENAEGTENAWAKDNLKGTTEMGVDNRGADWYRAGNFGPKMIVLTDWNQSGSPEKGGHQYSFFMYNEPQEGEKYYPEKPIFQEYGNPAVSAGSSGYDKEATKARVPGNSIQVELLLMILGMLGGSSKLEGGWKGAQEALKKVSDVSDAVSNYKESQDQAEILANRVAEDAEKEMVENTVMVDFEILYSNGEIGNRGNIDLDTYLSPMFLDEIKKVTLRKTSPRDPKKPFLTLSQAQRKLNSHYGKVD